MNLDALYRHWQILRMIPRKTRISTMEIHSRLKSEYGIETTLRTIQRDLSSGDIQRLVESPISNGQKIVHLPDGTFELIAMVDDTQQLRWWLKGYGERVEVLEPESLRQEFINLAKGYASMYQQ